MLVDAEPTISDAWRSPRAPILVVDDDAKIVRLVRTYLERDGFMRRDGRRRARPRSTPSRRTRPALVVLDLMLPELDGLAVIRAVRRDDESAATPIIILSARGSTDDRIAGLEAGADDYLPEAVLAGRARPPRRSRSCAGAGAAGERGTRRRDAPLIRHADLVLDRDRHEVPRRRPAGRR